jgi:hypothetical protein
MPTRKPTPRRACRFPGITADAQALGVHRATLFKLLAGYPGFVGLHGLRKRYDALKRRQAKEAA